MVGAMNVDSEMSTWWYNTLSGEQQGAWLHCWEHGPITDELIETLPPNRRPGNLGAWVWISIAGWLGIPNSFEEVRLPRQEFDEFLNERFGEQAMA
jgi:hypothetical protein